MALAVGPNSDGVEECPPVASIEWLDGAQAVPESDVRCVHAWMRAADIAVDAALHGSNHAAFDGTPEPPPRVDVDATPAATVLSLVLRAIQTAAATSEPLPAPADAPDAVVAWVLRAVIALRDARLPLRSSLSPEGRCHVCNHNVQLIVNETLDFVHRLTQLEPSPPLNPSQQP